MELSSKIGTVKGIGVKTEELFHNIGVYTFGDILLHYPKNYDRLPEIISLSELPEKISADGAGTVAAVAVHVQKTPFVRKARSMQITTLQVQEEAVRLDVVWFRMPYLRNTLTMGSWFVFLGKVTVKGNSYHMEQPQIFASEKYESMQSCLWPGYALTSGLSKNKLSQTIRQVLDELDLSGDYLPEEIRSRHQLAEYNFAIANIHFPENEKSLEEARKRLIFDEFFQFILSAGIQKEQMEEIQNDFSFLPLETEGLWADDVKESFLIS